MPCRNFVFVLFHEASKGWFPGESTVGKSSLLQMFLTAGSTFPRNYQMTMGIDFGVKEVEVSDCTVELYLFDVAGADVYRGIIDQYLSYFVFVYEGWSVFWFPVCDGVALLRQHLKAVLFFGSSCTEACCVFPVLWFSGTVRKKQYLLKQSRVMSVVTFRRVPRLVHPLGGG
eukprot:TRINITY_DN1120_c1_g1_i14.p1 TRINITY_DN1120_c1_g1~~TRINITY_DN1120_c1_g1_i14.p1  ORF type:complete len:172 (+),score=13.23 TRINITY_DN1120_c1_g1_i14:415-930(+)